MALDSIFSQMGLGGKQLTDRYSEYAAPAHEGHDPHVYYTYEPAAPAHGHTTHHVASSKHSYGGGHKSGASMSALTLLAFLFFLHILQQCIKDHMTEMTSPPLMVMTAGRERDDGVTKSNTNKIDKSGSTRIDTEEIDADRNNNNDKQAELYKEYDAKNPYGESAENNKYKKITAAENKPKWEGTKFKYVYDNYTSRNSYGGFRNAMESSTEN